MLDDELAGTLGERYSPYPTAARESLKRALEPLGFQPTEQRAK